MRSVAIKARANTLEHWLRHIDRVSLKSIDMGLERTNRVRNAMGLTPTFPVITVGGTNGKGSTCALLDAILSDAGYRVGRYASPHLIRANERVRIDRQEVTDADLCDALSAVDRARRETPLTYFEFGTLAAMRLFFEHDVDVAILEVGLGGRLDAVNVFDPDCAVITSVDMDHMDFLGDTREQIAFEKAGIFRRDRAAICAEPDVPDSMCRHALDIGAKLVRIGQDFGHVAAETGWRYWSHGTEYPALPYPALQGRFQLQNASACLTALEALKEKLPVSIENIRVGLTEASLSGRFQVLPGAPTVILDVAHNPHAAAALAGNLAGTACHGNTYAVFAMLKDKDVAGVLRALKGQVDLWLVAGIQERRGASAEDLVTILEAEQVSQRVLTYRSPVEAFAGALEQAGADDRIVVFGSFHTVAPVMEELRLTAR